MSGINSTNQAALQQPLPITLQLPTTQQDWTSFATILNQWLQYLAQSNAQYNPTFQSGFLAYSGPNGLQGNANFEVGLKLPNPSSSLVPALLLGSGGGAGTPITAAIIQDQAFDNVTPGNNLIITSGETQGAGVANGGNLSLYGGGSFGGIGGTTLVQGGTSFSGTGGPCILAGGNATSGGIPGDVFVLAGSNGGTGANIHLIMTSLGGTAGNVRIRVNSTILWQFDQYGAIFIGSAGCGTAGQTLHSGGPGAACYWA